MELKLSFHASGIVSSACSNRTFMELKYIDIHDEGSPPMF